MQKKLFWKDEYNVGNPVIDEAHKALFREVRRVEQLIAEDKYGKYDCIETIKFLRDYTKTHFAQEEAFMLRTGYPFYETHKAIHGNMTGETLPALENDLRERKYSVEAMKDFFAVFAGWLTGHILIEDRAITGKAESKYIRHEVADYDEIAALDAELQRFMRNMLDLKIRLVDKMYEGSKIENSFMYEVTFNGQYHVTMIAGYPLILDMVSKMLGVSMEEMSANVIIAYTQLADSIAKAVLEITYSSADFAITEKKGTVEVDFEEHFRQYVPQKGLLWTSDKGAMALCVDGIKNTL